MGSDYYSMPETFRLSSGRRILDEVAEMRERFGWTRPMDELMAIRQRYFREACHGTHLELLPCVEKVVRRLHDEGVPLAVTSSAVGAEIDAILRRTGIRDCFALIVDGAQVAHAKPDPEAYVVTAKKLGVPAEECVVFEDSNVGVRAAKAAGAFCVAVRNRSAYFAQDLSAADVVLESLCDVEITAASCER